MSTYSDEDEPTPVYFLTNRLVASGMLTDSDVNSPELQTAAIATVLSEEILAVERARQRVENAYMAELWQRYTKPQVREISSFPTVWL